MAYQLMVSKAQLKAIITALKVTPPTPTDGKGLDEDNLTYLLGALEDTIQEPEDDNMIHGICI